VLWRIRCWSFLASATTDAPWPATPSPARPPEPWDLARATLQHLAATRPDLAPVITRAASDPGRHTRDPVTLTVAALVVIALQTEVKLTRTNQGRWSFTLRKYPMRDSGLAQVITKLLGYLSGSK
jgi:hypothetical protein